MNQGTIIVADDDAQMLRALGVRLKSEGYKVYTAQDAYYALQLARENDPDALLLDINMPAGNGFSVHERLQKMTDLADTPIIYLTGERSERVTAGARELGAFALLHKPYDPEELLATIAEAVASRRGSTARSA